MSLSVDIKGNVLSARILKKSACRLGHERDCVLSARTIKDIKGRYEHCPCPCPPQRHALCASSRVRSSQPLWRPICSNCALKRITQTKSNRHGRPPYTCGGCSYELVRPMWICATRMVAWGGGCTAFVHLKEQTSSRVCPPKSTSGCLAYEHSYVEDQSPAVSSELRVSLKRPGPLSGYRAGDPVVTNGIYLHRHLSVVRTSACELARDVN